MRVKTLKTSVTADLLISLASGTPFLGQFAVSEPGRTLFLSGESGMAALQSIARRVRVPYGKDITEYAASGGDLAKWIAALDELDSPACCADLWQDEVMRAVARAGMVAVWRNER